MIKKLKRKFILMAMISLTVVLTAIMLVVNMINYMEITEDADRILTMLSQNHGEFPENTEKKDSWKEESKDIGGLLPETPYKTRFFSVIMEQGIVRRTNTNFIKSVSAEQANEYAKQVIDGDRTKGYFDMYRYLVTEDHGAQMVIFVECGTQMNYAYSFLLASISISILGLIFVFILVLICSNHVVKPVAESYKKQKQFITDSSHELKTPLSVISADIAIIEMNTGASEWIEDVKEQINYMAKLVKDLTALARMDESEVSMNKSRFNLSDAVVDTVQQFKPVIASSEKTLEIDIADSILYYGDEELVRRLISVLTDNAVKYSKTGITVRVFQMKSKIHIEFENDTADTLPEDVSLLFERFYRTDESRARESGGFGIGLSLAKSIVEMHGGKIYAVSEKQNKIKLTVILIQKLESTE